jgi:hypothetical protein
MQVKAAIQSTHRLAHSNTLRHLLIVGSLPLSFSFVLTVGTSAIHDSTDLLTFAMFGATACLGLMGLLIAKFW